MKFPLHLAIFLQLCVGNAQPPGNPKQGNNDNSAEGPDDDVDIGDQVAADIGKRGYNVSTQPNINDEFCQYINRTCPEMRTQSGVPITNETTKKLHIGIQILLVKLLEINEIEESFSIRTDMRVFWGLPECANWKAATHLGNEASQRLQKALINRQLPKKCYFHKKYMFIPLLLHLNAMGDTYAIEKTGNKMISVSQRGIAMMINKNRFDSICSLDFTFFPFDTQECQMELSAFSDDVAIAWADFGTPKGNIIGSSSIWELVSKNVTIVGGGSYTNAQFKLVISRRPNYHLLLIMGPTVVLTFLQLAVFLLPFDIPERSGYSITVVLAMQVSVAAVYSEIPVTSQPVYLAYYVGVCQMIGAAMTIYINLAVRLAESSKKPSKFVIKVDFIIGCCFVTLVLILNFAIFFALTKKIHL